MYSRAAGEPGGGGGERVGGGVGEGWVSLLSTQLAQTVCSVQSNSFVASNSIAASNGCASDRLLKQFGAK